MPRLVPQLTAATVRNAVLIHGFTSLQTSRSVAIRDRTATCTGQRLRRTTQSSTPPTAEGSVRRSAPPPYEPEQPVGAVGSSLHRRVGIRTPLCHYTSTKAIRMMHEVRYGRCLVRGQATVRRRQSPMRGRSLRCLLWPSSAVDRSSARRTCSARQPFCLPKNGSASRPMKLAKRLDTNQAARHEQRRRRRRPVDRHHSPRPAGSMQHRSTGAKQNSLIILTKPAPTPRRRPGTVVVAARVNRLIGGPSARRRKR